MQQSPIRYPGGKSRAVKILDKFIPEDVTKVVSPFFGGGSFENFLAKQGKEVIGYDLCDPLVCFWKAYLGRKNDVFARAKEMSRQILADKYWGVDKGSPEREEQRELYFGWRDRALNDPDPFERGLHYLALNRCAFSGMTLISGPRTSKWIASQFSISALENLEKVIFDVKSVDLLSCFDSVEKHSGDFLYLDPPYIMETEKKEGIYGEDGDLHRGFDHEKLRDLLGKHGERWVLSYLDVPRTRELYGDFNITNVNWTYGMKPGTSRPQGAEVVITNF